MPAGSGRLLRYRGRSQVPGNRAQRGSYQGRESGRLDARSTAQCADEPAVIIICVPTPWTAARDPDLTHVVNSARPIAERLRPRQLVVLTSTTYPGTTRDVVLPVLAAGGLRPGVDIFVAFSPEREDPGTPQFSAPTIPKVVGG